MFLTTAGFPPPLLGSKTGHVSAVEILLGLARVSSRDPAQRSIRASRRSSLDLGRDTSTRELHSCCMPPTTCGRTSHGRTAHLGVGSVKTATNDDEATPAYLLESVARHSGRLDCSAAELQNARASLTPSNRAWRRRRWLVMVRARTGRQQKVGNNSSGDNSEEGDQGVPREGGGGEEGSRGEGGRLSWPGGADGAGVTGSVSSIVGYR